VRGYGENQLGPRVLRVRAEDLIASGCTAESIVDATCDPSGAPASVFSPRPVGGTTLAEGSVELRVPLGGKIGGVVFADAAHVTTESDVGGAAAITPGVGLRYESNVGTLRLDLGWRPSRSEQLPVVVATEGASGVQRVTRLATHRAWIEGDGERGVWRHVTLHFVLGHAF
jgi:outer membrane protein assembly factor BamA